MMLGEIPGNADWTDKKIAKAYANNEKSDGDLRRRFVEQGFEAALGRKKRETPPVAPKITGEVEAQIVALTCSEPPGVLSSPSHSIKFTYTIPQQAYR